MKQKPGSEVAAPVAIELTCPKCGAPVLIVDEDVLSVTCGHCGSLLVLSHPSQAEIYVADGTFSDPQETLQICIRYRLQAQRAEIVSRYRDPEGNPPPEVFVQSRLAAFEQKLRQSARLHESRSLHVPYWHVTGKIVQGILGREQDIKLAKVRGYVVEHSTPGYDAQRFNLRDRGLRLARSRVRPLRRRDCSAGARFLPWVEVPEQEYREIDRWLGRDLDPRVEPIKQHGRFLFPQRILIYRPYWLSRISLDEGPRWVLLDGTFSTVAGYPDESEVEALTAATVENPLGEQGESHLRAHVSASRCPDCGAEQTVEPHAHFLVCTNCHRLLEPTPEGIRLASYDHIAPAGAPRDADQLPFWRFPFAVTVEGRRVETLEEYAAAVFPQGLPTRFSPRGSHLWVPAIRLLTTEAGDACFKALSEWIHAGAPPIEDGKLPLGAGRPSFWSAALDEEGARSLAHFALLGLYGKTAAARLNALSFRRAFEQAELELGPGRLVVIPFARSGEEVSAPGVRVPMLLLRGGPVLEAQRLSVQAAARKVDP